MWSAICTSNRWPLQGTWAVPLHQSVFFFSPVNGLESSALHLRFLYSLFLFISYLYVFNIYFLCTMKRHWNQFGRVSDHHTHTQTALMLLCVWRMQEEVVDERMSRWGKAHWSYSTILSPPLCSLLTDWGLSWVFKFAVRQILPSSVSVPLVCQ